ncbi:hypothetical protein [Amycolatopsis minnesotensis]
MAGSLCLVVPTAHASTATQALRPAAARCSQAQLPPPDPACTPDTDMGDYEDDHLLPLELGGAPRDPRNLWPDPHDGDQNSYSKDRVENAVKKAVCAKKVTLAAAQHAMLTDWTTAKSVLGIG